MVSDKTLAGMLIVGIVLAVGISYQLANMTYGSEIDKKTSEIAQLEQRIAEKEAQVQTLRASLTPGTEIVSTETIAGEVDCKLCHDMGQTKVFHVPQTIMEIDAAKDLRRRICIDCHGPLGPPWSADEQMTELKDITYYIAGEGLNGVFDFPDKVPHSIHKRKLDAGAMKCETCHLIEGQFAIPKAVVSEGQVLVCQNCKYHPEGGNYIKIHVEDAGLRCTVCHIGGIINVHKEKTTKLGEVPEIPWTKEVVSVPEKGLTPSPEQLNETAATVENVTTGPK
ncbi:MAG: hypothetical protein ACE5PM_04415 [Candidatus Hydrothermarchaeales archaeon]